MENEVLEEIKAFAVKKLAEAYGCCGCAVSSDAAHISGSDNNGNDIVITLKIQPE